MKIISTIWLKMAFIFDPVQKFFNGDFWKEFNRLFAKYLKESVVDLACGTGEMRKYIKPKKYLGVDINQNYVRLARKKYPYKNTVFQLGNILKLKLSKKYDSCFLISAAHHLSDANLVKLFSSVDKTNTKYFILVDGYPIGLFSKLLEWLDDKLGGGAYFRGLKDIINIADKQVKIVKSGEFGAKNSFYRYTYIIARIRN